MAAGSTPTLSRGWQGAVLKLMGADDYELTVTGTSALTDHYLRLEFSGGGLLTARGVHPTMWVRLWFADGGKLHQRGYTLVDPEVDSDSFAIEFAIHDGTAARWAQTAAPGDTITATLMGSKFALPEPAPKGWLIVGDSASLPAINSLLDAVDASADAAVPATVWFECSYDDERELPLKVRPHDTVHYLARTDGGAALIDDVRSKVFDASGYFGWVATESASTRSIASIFRSDYRLGRKAVKSQAYWVHGRSFA